MKRVGKIKITIQHPDKIGIIALYAEFMKHKLYRYSEVNSDMETIVRQRPTDIINVRFPQVRSAEISLTLLVGIQ
jgi:DNA primase